MANDPFPPLCREEHGILPLQVRQRPHRRPTRPDASTAIHLAVLVRQAAHVLAAARLVPVLCRVDHFVPARAAGQREHCVVAACLHGHCGAGERHAARHLWGPVWQKRRDQGQQKGQGDACQGGGREEGGQGLEHRDSDGSGRQEEEEYHQGEAGAVVKMRNRGVIKI